MNRIRAFGVFLYELVIGDAPMIAAVIIVALGVTALIASAGTAAWWLTAPAVIGALAALRHPTRQAPSPIDTDGGSGTHPRTGGE